uniref:Uncharacterized protein n=1 Tax=Rhizophora mucronata TaxID=61149 RepID=A0A2P2R0R7_RHIMU
MTGTLVLFLYQNMCLPSQILSYFVFPQSSGLCDSYCFVSGWVPNAV